MKTVGEGSCKWPNVPTTDWFSCTVSECAQLAVQCDYLRSATTAVRLSSSLLSASWWRWSETFTFGHFRAHANHLEIESTTLAGFCIHDRFLAVCCTFLLVFASPTIVSYF